MEKRKLGAGEVAGSKLTEHWAKIGAAVRRARNDPDRLEARALTLLGKAVEMRRA